MVNSKHKKSTKSDENVLYCAESCVHDRKETQEMLRCCSCNKWFHFSCVGETDKTGIWNCSICSNTGQAILSLVQDVLSLKVNIGTVIHIINTIPEEIGTLNSKIEDLTGEVKHLQTTNTSLVQQLNDQNKVITEYVNRILNLNYR